MTASFIPSLLKELDDVAITTPAVGHVVRYNGAKWINQQLSHLDLTNIGTNTHAQIDTHIAGATNPHGTLLTQQDIRIPVGGTLWMGTTNPTPGAGDVFVIHRSYDSNQLMTLRNTHVSGISGIRFEDELGLFKGWLGYFNTTDIWTLNVGGNPALVITDGYAISPGYFAGFSSRLTIDGNCAIGNGYRTVYAPTNGLIIEGAVGIGTPSPAATAALDITSVSKGILIPRMTTTQRDTITTPAQGLLIYNTTTNKFNFYNGTIWEVITSA